MRRYGVLLLWLLCLVSVVRPLHAAEGDADRYDPLRVIEQPAAPIDLTVEDLQRQRSLPIRVYLPASPQPEPVLLFSHGLGGSRETNPFLGQHWAARGYAAVFVQHPGSDEMVWKDKSKFRRIAAMRQAANEENFRLRVQDVTAVIDQLQVWNADPTHPLAGRLELSKIGMSGHSFGARTSQALGGQRFGREQDSLSDPRIRAALLLSPSAPKRGDPNAAFGAVKIPWLLMTGTEDVSPISDTDVESRLAVFPALPPVGRYELLLHGAEHSAFTDRPLPGDSEKRNPNHHRAVLALSTAFWDTWLRDDAAARLWLEGSGPQTVLEAEDRWQRK